MISSIAMLLIKLGHENSAFTLCHNNLLFALQGKFPGLIVRLSGGDWVVYSEVAASSSVNNIKEVLVLIDNVVMGGTAADILGRIDPTTVESIEYTNRLKSIYGLQGNSGVLSIYTKYSGLGLGTTAA